MLEAMLLKKLNKISNAFLLTDIKKGMKLGGLGEMVGL